MLKRIIPLISVLSLLLALFVFPASAKEVAGRTVIDYNDYISRIDVDGDNDIVTVSLPAYMYGVSAKDDNGERWTQGVDLGRLDIGSGGSYYGSAGVYYPGGVITKTYLDLSNIPNGSTFTFPGKFWLDAEDLNSNQMFTGSFWSNVQYYNDRFEPVGSQPSMRYDIDNWDGSYAFNMTYSVSLDIPTGARYCVTFFRFSIDGVYPSGGEYTLWFDFDFPSLKMSINSLYRLQEQSGKTNKLLDQIVNGDVNAVPPEGSGSVGDLDDLEGALNDDTAAGREEADQVFNESWGLVVAHMSGFLFLSNVIERMIGVGWLRGLIVVSLSLGILGFIANIAMIMGRNGRDGKDAKSSKSGKGG